MPWASSRVIFYLLPGKAKVALQGKNNLRIVLWGAPYNPPNPEKLEVTKKWLKSDFWGRGSGGVKSAGVSQSVRETGRDESQSVPSPDKLFKTRHLEFPIFEGSLPSCSPHSAGYTRTSVHPYFPVAKTLGVLPKVAPKVTPKVPFRPEKVTFESLWGSKSHFWGHFRGHFWVTWGRPESHFWVTFGLLLIFGGLGGSRGHFRPQP